MSAAARKGIAAAVLASAALAAGCEGAADPADNPFQCVGLPTATCERFLDEARRSVPNSPPISALIQCTKVCTEQQGDATVLVIFANGERVEYGTGWASSQGGGADPVEPVPVPPDLGATPAPSAPPGS